VSGAECKPDLRPARNRGAGRRTCLAMMRQASNQVFNPLRRSARRRLLKSAPPTEATARRCGIQRLLRSASPRVPYAAASLSPISGSGSGKPSRA
jgi:hypothetical protein